MTRAMIKATYEAHMGDDLTIVNAARVSFGKRSTWETINGVVQPKPADQSLIRFLARGCRSGDWNQAIVSLMDAGNSDAAWDEREAILKWAKNMPTHWTPFAHTAITLIEEIPIFVARQRFKHTIGFVYNEVSRRYVTDEPTFYEPEAWRKAAEDKKQGSGGAIEASLGIHLTSAINEFNSYALIEYEHLLSCGVCPEQARMVLPQSMMTTYWVTGNVYSFAQAYLSRSRPDAQKEIRDLAAEWDRIIRPLFPTAWSALVD